MQMTFVELNARRVSASTAQCHAMVFVALKRKREMPKAFLFASFCMHHKVIHNWNDKLRTHTICAQWDWNRCASYIYRTDTRHRRPQNSLFKWITLRKWLNSSQRPVHDEITLQLRSSRTMTCCHHPKIPTRKSMTICFCTGISIYMSVVPTILHSNTNHHPLAPFAS